MKQYEEYCDKCEYLYRVIDTKTRRIVGCICYLWYDGMVGQYEHYASMDHEHCFKPKKKGGEK